MATYFPGLIDQREDLQMSLLPNEKHQNSYESPGFQNNLMYLNHPSTIASYPDLPSLSAYSAKPFNDQSVEQNLQYQGLSLSLAMQVPSSVQIPPYHDQYTNPGFSALMATQMMGSEQGSHNDETKRVEYVSFGLEGDNLERPMSLREMNFSPHIHDVSGSIYNSKYLKATQELLEEVVSVHRSLRKPDKNSAHSFGQDEDADLKSSSCSGNGMSSDGHKSSDTSCELSAAQRHDLESKITKLFSMLDEVDKRYKQYYQQMQDLVSSFEMIVGLGSAKPYTSLALRTISCQFRCLRDAIKKQIQVARQSLGEGQGGSSQGERLYRLRYVDQKLRQQRTLHQFGLVMRQPWRPQRGLPENAVSVLRAWLFEHFLHPYPKDSEKSMLARQTGLTRSQVANWFINARVRLWKPMIEDMYKEEFGDNDDEDAAEGRDFSSNSSPKRTKGTAKDNPASDGEGNGVQQHTTTLFNQTGHEGIIQPNNIPMFGGGNQVSLALGLQQNQNDDDSKADYYYMDQQERFANSHILPDFVV
ncbi:hypothetical protein DM860_006526 [Cuscuta australis]|uniref:Homeobox domain-containing protein n=2 Tax=Cuscuta sect. Cleistogrammica TaxID=1824901 RepID=A0A328D4J2_9ASTE|nr:hypothetical protein DM860_006526 [Cuscuta australis]